MDGNINRHLNHSISHNKLLIQTGICGQHHHPAHLHLLRTPSVGLLLRLFFYCFGLGLRLALTSALGCCFDVDFLWLVVGEESGQLMNIFVEFVVLHEILMVRVHKMS